MKIKITIKEGAWNRPQTTAPFNRQTVDVEDDEDREKLAEKRKNKANDSIENWEHKDAQKYAFELIEKYGEPDVVTDQMVLWEEGISKFDKTYVLDESIEHCCPKPHRDYVYSTMTIDVPQDLMEPIAKASESIIVDQLKNKVTARCADIVANAITLGFVQKLVEGKIVPKDAKKEYERHIIDGIVPEWFKEEQNLSEKKKKDDRCTRIAKRKYDVWPSAYASGAVVRCRQGKIWKGLKEILTEEEFTPHMMYNPKTGKKKMSKKHEDHVELAKKGYTHVDPKVLKKILDDEGGAAGLEPFVKGTGASKKEIKLTLKLMPNVKQHKEGDYVETDGLQEKKKKAGTESSKESSLRDWFGRKGGKGKSKGWVDCNTCRKDKKTGKKTCKACGRQEGEKRSKYPACRPTPSACDEKGKGKSWGKKSAKGKK